jgi:Arc/MetJ-type ribon-helix-helix transcriptional regulator
MSTEPTTLALPSDLLAAVDKVVQEGLAGSRDELVESALRRQLAELRRSALDAEFRHMADDIAYQAEAHQILAEFAQADFETLDEGPSQGANHQRS